MLLNALRFPGDLHADHLDPVRLEDDNRDVVDDLSVPVRTGTLRVVADHLLRAPPAMKVIVDASIGSCIRSPSGPGLPRPGLPKRALLLRDLPMTGVCS